MTGPGPEYDICTVKAFSSSKSPGLESEARDAQFKHGDDISLLFLSDVCSFENWFIYAFVGYTLKFSVIQYMYSHPLVSPGD